MHRNVFSVIIILLIIAMISNNTLAASNELNNTQNVNADLQLQVKQLDNQINEVLHKVDKNKKDMNEIANDIKNSGVKLKMAKKISETQNKIFDKRIRAMYISGMNGYFQILLTSNDINEFISRIYAVSKILTFDKNIVDKFEKNEQAISEQTQTLIDEKNKLEYLKTSNQAALTDLNSDIWEQKYILTMISQKQELLSDVEKAAEIKKDQFSKQVALNDTDISSFTLSRGSISSKSYSRVLNMEATAYSDEGITASGLPAQKGVIAVDPRVVPMGTKVYIEGYGYAIAADTGGAIKGNIIDVFLPSNSDAKNWGRKHVNVYILN